MGIDIHTATSITDEALHELIIQSLDKLLGSSNYELIAPQLPFDGHHILAIDKYNKPAMISYDNNDGGNALLSGIAALEKLSSSRSLFYRLYPRLSEITHSNNDALKLENIRLIILAPNLAPGAHYLTRQLSNISVFTYHTLQINNDFGLLIESCHRKTNDAKPTTTPAPTATPEFRTAKVNLNKAEELYFQEI